MLPSANSVSGRSADDPDVLLSKLPTLEEEARQAAEYEAMFHFASRRGAGLNTFVGAPAIRPHGQKAFDAFHDMLSGGRTKERAPTYSEAIRAPKGPVKLDRQVPHLRLMLPRTFCPMCPDGGSTSADPVGVIPNLSHFDCDRDDLGVKADQVIVYFFCNNCAKGVFKRHTEEKWRPQEASMMLANADGSLVDIKAKQRQEELDYIRRNVEAFLRAKRWSDDGQVWVNKELD